MNRRTERNNGYGGYRNYGADSYQGRGDSWSREKSEERHTGVDTSTLAFALTAGVMMAHLLGMWLFSPSISIHAHPSVDSVQVVSKTGVSKNRISSQDTNKNYIRE